MSFGLCVTGYETGLGAVPYDLKSKNKNNSRAEAVNNISPVPSAPLSVFGGNMGMSDPLMMNMGMGMGMGMMDPLGLNMNMGMGMMNPAMTGMGGMGLGMGMGMGGLTLTTQVKDLSSLIERDRRGEAQHQIEKIQAQLKRSGITDKADQCAYIRQLYAGITGEDLVSSIREKTSGNAVSKLKFLIDLDGTSSDDLIKSLTGERTSLMAKAAKAVSSVFTPVLATAGLLKLGALMRTKEVGTAMQMLKVGRWFGPAGWAAIGIAAVAGLAWAVCNNNNKSKC